MMRRVL